MRILLVCDFYPPQVGGMEKHVQSLARQFALLGHDVFVATTDNQDKRNHIDGIEIVRFKGTAQRLTFAFSSANRRYPPPLIDPEFTRKVGAYIDEIRPDVIHVHGWTLYSVLMANRSRRLPVVATLHDYGHICPKRTFLREDGICIEGRGLRCIPCAKAEYGIAKSLVTFGGTGIEIRQLRSVDAFIAVSSYVKERSIEYIRDQAIHVIPNFIDPGELGQNQSGEELDLPSDFILFVGVLAPFKGVDDLIEAFLRAKRSASNLANAKLLLLGRSDPVKQYASLPASDIHLIENPPRALVIEAFRRTRCLVVPSRWAEPCPTVVLEGLAAKRPVIGTMVGGIPELLRDAPFARLAPPADPQALAEAIVATYDQPFEETLAESMFNTFLMDYLPLHPTQIAANVIKIYEQAQMKRHQAEVR